MFKFNTLQEDIAITKSLLSKSIDTEIPYFENLICKWKENKKELIPFFGETGRMQIKISNINYDNIDKEFILSQVRYNVKKILDKLNQSRISDEYVWFFQDVLAGLGNEEILNNKIKTKTTYTIHGKDYTFCENTKVSTILKTVLKTYENTDLKADTILIIYSRLVQEFRTDTTLVLSINPLDYLLVSAHTTGWHSCHNYDTGEFRVGSMSHMIDETSIVAYTYRKTDKIVNSDDYEYPVKEWRQMIYFDLQNAIAVHSREYPNNNAIYNQQARKLSAKILADYHQKEYNWIVTFEEREKGLKNEEETLSSIKDCDFNCSYHLYGIGLGYLGDKPTSYIQLNNDRIEPDIVFGSNFHCLHCGNIMEEDNDNCDSENFLCFGCLNIFHCYECGSKQNLADEHFTPRDHSICEFCFNEYYFTCSDCNTVNSTDNESDTKELCYTCYLKHNFKCEICSNIYSSDEVTKFNDKIICTECFDEHYKECNGCHKGHLENNDLCERCQNIGLVSKQYSFER